MPDNWNIFASKTHAIEKAFLPVVRQAIRNFRSQFIKDLQTNGVSTAKGNLSLHMLDEQTSAILQRIYRQAGKMGARLLITEMNQKLSYEDKAYIARYQQEQKAGFGKNERWVKEVLDYLATNGLEMVTSITNTMRQDVLKILQMAIDKGWSIDETVRQLQGRYVVTRARRIVRTEINTAANAGHKKAAEALPFEVDKVWVAAQDERTRPGHRDIHKHRTDENGLFNVPVYDGLRKIGVEEMEGPGDPKASAGNRVNCRCRRIYEPKRNAAGRPIMRNRNQAPVIPMRKPLTYTNEQIAAQLKSAISITIES